MAVVARRSAKRSCSGGELSRPPPAWPNGLPRQPSPPFGVPPSRRPCLQGGDILGGLEPVPVVPAVNVGPEAP